MGKKRDEIEYEFLESEPLPVKPSRRGTTKYPFAQMEVGMVIKVKAGLPTARDATKRWGAVHGGKFVLRDAGDGWTKIWRVS